MDIGIVTIFPQMCDAVSQYGILARALEKQALNLKFWDPRDFTKDPHRTVDDRPYGGGAGMLLKPAPLACAIDAAQQENAGLVVYFTPQGKQLDQGLMAELASVPTLLLVAGRYEGIDERIIDSRVDQEVSIGDYVLAGGELAAMMLVEGIARLLPGVLNNAMSSQQDSFSDCLLEYPHYTRPQVFEGRVVPEVLLSGDHDAVRRWRLKQALGRTHERRPDLLARRELDGEQIELLSEYRLEKNHEQPN